VRSAFIAIIVVASALAGVAPVDAQTREGPTFTRDVAPILFTHCAACHHPDGPAPFSVLTYAAARQRARQIAEATARRYMPPWKTAPGPHAFIGEHRLRDEDIATLGAWAAAGAPEGSARDLPPRPEITSGWQLGAPDLVVALPQYDIEASGADRFRIFVVNVPTESARYVRGIEFRPGLTSVVHHANIRVDRTPTSRRLDDEDPSPGYDGLLAHSAQYPDGHFLAWTPGQAAPLLPKGLAWRLDPGTDLVVELHLQPTGKRELIAPSIGFYFGADPPERTPGMLRLGRQNIDIAPGERRYVVRDSFVLPVDVEVLAVQPHAHYRAREVRGTATLPDGTTTPLITIPDWDFRWQQVYRYQRSVPLPRGTTLAMEYVYDNSDANPRNVIQPPQRVVWGQRAADEMGDLWVQVLTRSTADLETLLAAFRPKAIAEDVVGYEARIRAEPQTAALHDDVALLYLEQGETAAAVRHFREVTVLRPASAAAHYNLATALTISGALPDAIASFNEALRLRPDYVVAHNNLGAVLLQSGRLTTARLHLQEAARLDPDNADAWQNLGRLELQAGNAAAARGHFTRAVEITGRRDVRALDGLAAAHAVSGDLARAAEIVDEALRLDLDASVREVLRRRLEQYRAGEPGKRP
jgi:Tfp pilus assembly protein PilF/mono/diheme cytochrome c family protein